MTKLLTVANKKHTAQQIIESITEPANTAYYVFVGDHYEHANSELQPIYDNENMKLQAYRNMVFGKRVEENDVRLMIRNIPYVSNTVYAMYDDSNTAFLDTDFYVVVNATSFYHVFKCLDNNSGNTSTVEPNFAHIVGANTFVYETSDGYRWKYMYTVDSANVIKFETENYFPFIANATVEADSQYGAIDIIKVEGEGKGYDNYVYGTFAGADIKIDGDSTLFQIANSVASTTNGYYTGCMMYVSAGTGSGQYRLITNSYSNSTGVYFQVNTNFTPIPATGSEYQITPSVQIIGDGQQTINAQARALVNALASNSIYRVEMLERGRGYTYHKASVVANAVVNVVSNAIVRSIYSPLEGHGFDGAEELGASAVSIVVKVSNNESNTITIDNQIQQIGLLRDPLFANVEIELKNANGEFATGETIYEIRPVRLNTNATSNSDLSTIECATADFENQVKAGDHIYIKSGNGVLHQLMTIESVTNSSVINCTANAFFSCTETIIYQANITSNAVITSANSSTLFVSNVNGLFLANDMFIGIDSGATAYVNAISRNDSVKTFDTFQQLYKYTGTLVGGAFVENEVVYQSNLNTANAFLHSAGSNNGTYTIYTSNQVGKFEKGGDIVGNTSGAIFTINEAYSPELIPGSGEILFIENIAPVVRSANTNETFRFIFEY